MIANGSSTVCYFTLCEVQGLSLIHIYGRGGEKILAGDLLDAHALFAPFDVCGDAGDHLFFVLGQ